MDRQRDSFFLWMFLLQTPSYRRMSIAICLIESNYWYCRALTLSRSIGPWPCFETGRAIGVPQMASHGVVEPRPCFFVCVCLSNPWRVQSDSGIFNRDMMKYDEICAKSMFWNAVIINKLRNESWWLVTIEGFMYVLYVPSLADLQKWYCRESCQCHVWLQECMYLNIHRQWKFSSREPCSFVSFFMCFV